jgi:hypothetical protein
MPGELAEKVIVLTGKPAALARNAPCLYGDVAADFAVFLLSHRARLMTGCIAPVGGGAELGYRR